MKLCLECLQELFDNDIICYYCQSKILINDCEINNIKNDLLKANKINRKKLIQNKKYNCVYQYMMQKQGERYWVDANNKSVSYNVIYPRSNNQSNSQIVCPYCKSTDTKKIDVVSRGTSFGLFGFGSSKVGKQWHCNRCKQKTE